VQGTFVGGSSCVEQVPFDDEWSSCGELSCGEQGTFVGGSSYDEQVPFDEWSSCGELSCGVQETCGDEWSSYALSSCGAQGTCGGWSSCVEQSCVEQSSCDEQASCVGKLSFVPYYSLSFLWYGGAWLSLEMDLQLPIPEVPLQTTCVLVESSWVYEENVF